MILLVLLISLLGVIETHGSCEFSPLKQETSVLGTTRRYCEYQVRDGHSAAALKVLQGASFKTLDCHTCTCNQYGMRCCPSNRDPRTLRVPPYCRVIMDGCTPTAVRKADNRTDCYTAQPVTHVRQQRQRMNRVMKTFNEIDRYQRQQQQKGGEPLEQNDIMMLLMMGDVMNDPYAPIGTTGGVMGGGMTGAPAGRQGGYGAGPFAPMNDLNTLMMFSMMGS